MVASISGTFDDGVEIVHVDDTGEEHLAMGVTFRFGFESWMSRSGNSGQG